MSSSGRILWWQNGHYYQFIDESRSWSNAAEKANEEYIDGIGTKNPNTIGLRVPDNELTIQLLNEIGPLAVTSANTSGDEEAKNDSEAYEMFKDNIGYYLEGTSIHGDGSTVVDFRVTGGEILRQGPLKWPPSYC